VKIDRGPANISYLQIIIANGVEYQRLDYNTENYRSVWRQTHYNLTDKFFLKVSSVLTFRSVVILYLQIFNKSMNYYAPDVHFGNIYSVNDANDRFHSIYGSINFEGISLYHLIHLNFYLGAEEGFNCRWAVKIIDFWQQA
jgi:hypothetical protein